MPFIPVPDVAMVEMVHNTPGGVAENTLYFRKLGGWITGELTTLAVNMAAWWVGEMRDIVSQDVSLTGIRVTALDSPTAPSIEYPISPPFLGSLPSAAVPSNATLATTFLTEFRGRSFRGRNYFIGLSDATVTGDIVTADQRAAINSAYNQLIAVTPLPAEAWVVVSKFANGAPRAIGISTAVIAVKGDTNVDSQRRRLRGRGS